jgi:hypothetical protein
MVRGKLLSLSNLPAGWTLTNVPATNKGYSGPCAAALSPKPRPGLTEAYIAFTDRGRSPLLGEKVVFGKAVTNRYNYVNAVLKSCKYLTFALGGINEKGTVDPLSFPKLGSSSSAYTITVPTTLGVSVGIDIVIVRSGPYALVVEYSTMGTPDSSVLETFVHQALAPSHRQTRFHPLPFPHFNRRRHFRPLLVRRPSGHHRGMAHPQLGRRVPSDLK